MRKAVKPAGTPARTAAGNTRDPAITAAMDDLARALNKQLDAPQPAPQPAAPPIPQSELNAVEALRDTIRARSQARAERERRIGIAMYVGGVLLLAASALAIVMASGAMLLRSIAQ